MSGRKKTDFYGGNLCEGQFFFEELRLPYFSLNCCYGQKRGVNPWYGDMGVRCGEKLGTAIWAPLCGHGAGAEAKKGLFGYKLGCFCGFIAVFHEFFYVSAKECREKAINFSD